MLKDIIKEKASHEFDGFDAHHLQLWKVDIPYGDSEELQRFVPGDKDRLNFIMTIGDLYPEDLPDDHIHIVVKAPGK